MATLTEIVVGVETLTCCECGIAFSVPTSWVNQKREDHTRFVCPNNHTLSFHAKSEVDQLRDQLTRERQRADQIDAYRRMETREKEHAQRRLASTQGVVTRVKRRIANGVCPCCKRTFADLARHMKGKHPDYATEAAS